MVNVEPSAVESLRRLGNVSVDIKIADLRQLVRDQAAKRTRRWDANASRDALGALPDPYFDEYRELDTVKRFMLQLADQHPDIARHVASIGTSYEGRTIPALVIGGRDGGPAIYLHATLHVREWITTTTIMYLAVELLESEDPEIRGLVQDVRFFIVPVTNPDGYVFTFTEGGRMWRKSRSANEGSTCIGTDLNRNFNGGDWGGVGASSDPCSNTYRGAGPFSEVEVAAVRDYVQDIASGHALLGGIDYHSFGQVLLRPYAWTADAAPNDGVVQLIGDRMSEAASASPNGVPYTAGTWFNDLYPSSGTCADWLYSLTSPHGVVFTNELRDTGTFGFVLPDSEIRPTGEEQVAALKVYGSSVLASWKARTAARQ